MPKEPDYPYMTKRYNTWFARMVVPRDVQAVIGRTIFIASTGEANPHKAHDKAAPWLAEWRQRIETARKTNGDPLKADIDRLASLYRQAKGNSLDEAASLLVGDVLDFVFQHTGGVSRIGQRQALLNSGGDVAEAMTSLPKASGAAGIIGQIMGTATPFLSHLDGWKAATPFKGKTLDQALSRINKFASDVPQTIESLQGKHVQAWIEARLSAGINPVTIRNYLTSIRHYWGWMQAHEIVPESARPFWNRKIVSRKTEIEKAEEERARFEPAEVVRLWQKAESIADQPLLNMIRLAAYTGARREALVALKKGSIMLTGEIPFIHFADKTKSGIRDVPIHSEIANLVTELVENADADGYLVDETSVNKYGKRGDAIGKRFSRMKKSMGFGALHTFHSIRHTVAHLFELAECPENIAQDVIGHKKQSMTYGTYSGVTTLAQKRQWIERAIVYPASSKS
jgi:integrase